MALPRPAGLLLEKLVTDRTGEKGERDLLVALGVLAHASGPRGSRARPAAVRLSADVLGAEALVLVPFPAPPSSD